LVLAGELRHYASSGPAAMALCILIDGGTLQSLGMNGGIACVVVLTLDRYWKIVHPIHHRKYYRRWMLYVGLFLPWLNGAAAHLLPATGTSRIVNGVCRPNRYWPSEAMDKVISVRRVSIVFFFAFYILS